MRKALALSLVAISVICGGVSADEERSQIPCLARAWVRAPDLEPGRLVQGHLKVKLDGACEDVSSYNLGLRFTERSWVKTPRKGATLPVNPMEENGQVRRVPRKTYSNDSTHHIGWGNWVFPELDQKLWDQYQSDMDNPALWVMWEEERTAFETKYAFSDGGQMASGIVRDFVLLVPSTNYPPAFDKTFNIGSLEGINAAGAEHIYQYFVDLEFSDGTRREIEAGYTSFNIATTTEPTPELEDIPGEDIERGITRLGQESINVTAALITNRRPYSSPRSSFEAKDKASRDIFNLEITFPTGRRFEQGSFNNITVVSHQLGPGTHRPVNIRSVFARVKQRRPWAAKHAADNETAEKLLSDGTIYDRELRPTFDDMVYPFRSWLCQREYSLPQFSQESPIKSGAIFSTEAVTAHFEVADNIYPPFQMYYQTSEVDLVVEMLVRNISGTEHELQHDEPDDEEYDWTSTLRQAAYIDTDIVQATIPISVYRQPEHGHPSASLIDHYLSPEARAPVFMDPSSLPQLLQMTTKGRDALAPFTQPKSISKAGRDVVKHRYSSTVTRSGQYYVGNTWLRKVVTRAPGNDQDVVRGIATLVQVQPMCTKSIST